MMKIQKPKQKQTKIALVNLQTIPSKTKKKKTYLEYLPKLIETRKFQS